MGVLRSVRRLTVRRIAETMIAPWFPEVAHQSALLPLAALLVAWRSAPHAYKLLALSLAVSWPADSAAYYLGDPWVLSLAWLPVQLTLAVAAFRGAGRSTWLVLIGLVVLAVSSALWWPGDGHDLLVAVAGSAAVLAFSEGELALPSWIYFGAGTLAYLGMILHMDDLRAGDPTWAVYYQDCRLLAFASFLALVLWKRRSPWPTA